MRTLTTRPKHLAFAPVLNAGHADRLVERFEFSCGACLARGRPREVWDNLSRLDSIHDISESERSHFALAGGWIWLSSDERAEPPKGKRNAIAICGRLARKVQSLLWFIDLCGGGENHHWSNGNNRHCCGAYTVTNDELPPGMTFRSPYLFSTPQAEYREAPWTLSIMLHADAIEQSLAKVGREGVHPRIAIASDMRRAMCAWNAYRHRMRLQLCVSALETLLIAPSERMYVWDAVPKARLRQICQSQSILTDEFFDKLKERRNNANHRGGVATDGTTPRFDHAEMRVEVVLREAICWAMMNAAALEEDFEKDCWPSHLPALNW